MKTWSQSCHSFYAVNALASPKLSKRATPKASRLCTYIESTLDNFARTARLLLRQNQSVQLRLICIYVCPTSAHWGFWYGLDVTKITLLP